MHFSCRIPAYRTHPHWWRNQPHGSMMWLTLARIYSRVFTPCGRASRVWPRWACYRALSASFRGSTPAGVLGWAGPIRPSFFLFAFFL
jgi:hypothetical protein